jgi:hypothetical protein
VYSDDLAAGPFESGFSFIFLYFPNPHPCYHSRNAVKKPGVGVNVGQLKESALKGQIWGSPHLFFYDFAIYEPDP